MERVGNYKIKAFTILELIVVLTISAIVIALGYTTYKLISQLYTNRVDNFVKVEKATTVRYLIERDFFMAQSAIVEEELTLIGEDTIYYNWVDDKIIRRVGNGADSFDLKIKEVQFLFEDDRKDEGLIDQIIWVDSADKKMNLLKEYAAAIKMNKNGS